MFYGCVQRFDGMDEKILGEGLSRRDGKKLELVGRVGGLRVGSPTGRCRAARPHLSSRAGADRCSAVVRARFSSSAPARRHLHRFFFSFVRRRAYEESGTMQPLPRYY